MNKIQLPDFTRNNLSLAARQLKRPVLVVYNSHEERAELKRYRLREQRAESAAIACEIMADQNRKHRARSLHLEKTAHVRDNTEEKPQKVTITDRYVHTTLALNSVTAVPLKLPLWQRLWNWLHAE